MARLVPLLSLMIALLFAAGGAAKLFRFDFEQAAFKRFELPFYAMTVAGLAEWTAAALLLRRSTATLGAIIGVGIMVIATAAHLHAGEMAQAVLPVGVMTVLAWIGWQRRADLGKWLAAQEN